MAIKDKLRELLDAKQMKSADLARATGLSEATISYYLNGKKEPMGKTCAKLAKALNVTVDELLESGFETEKKPTTASDDGLSAAHREFIENVKTLEESELRMVEEIVDSVLRARGK